MRFAIFGFRRFYQILRRWHAADAWWSSPTAVSQLSRRLSHLGWFKSAGGLNPARAIARVGTFLWRPTSALRMHSKLALQTFDDLARQAADTDEQEACRYEVLLAAPGRKRCARVKVPPSLAAWRQWQLPAAALRIFRSLNVQPVCFIACKPPDILQPWI